jgi:hypothetical protein
MEEKTKMKQATRRKEQQTKKEITKRGRYFILNGEKVLNGADVGRQRETNDEEKEH